MIEGFVEAVRASARERGDSPAFTELKYHRGNDASATTRSYTELDRDALAIGNWLSQRSRKGARVAIVCPQDYRYVAAFVGCLYAGRIAVPLPNVESYRPNDRLVSVISDAEPEIVLTAESTMDQVADVLREADLVAQVVAVEELVTIDPAGWSPEPMAPSDLAYLQYTSGSTGTPSGVRITHGNIRANTEQILGFAPFVGPGATTVSWVPYFHDLGLVTGLVVPLAAGAHVVQLSPTAFIQVPYRWLKAVSDYRSCWMVGPNFSYDLCVRRVRPELKGDLDLSCVHGLISGGEMVRPDSQRAFFEAFSECGLKPHIDAGSYGLAEATLCVTSWNEDSRDIEFVFDRDLLAANVVRRVEPDSPTGRPMAPCGTALKDIDVRIVDPESHTEVVGEGVGEIWVQGPNIADGYWRQPERTAEVFGAVCDGLPGQWLRTGDLGFFHNGLLFVSGRRKDLIVIDGKNHDPADIEATIEGSPAGSVVECSAALSVDDGHAEQVVIVTEVRRVDMAEEETRTELGRNLRRVVHQTHGIHIQQIVLVPRGTIPKTSSRKVRRSECKSLLLASKLKIIDRV